MTSDLPKPPLSEATRLVGERVRLLRRELGQSQEAFAEVATLHWSYVSRVERGQVNMTLHNLVRLAEALQVPPADLLVDLP